MALYIYIGIIILLSMVIIQDFRFRAVSWIIFPILFMLGIWILILNNGKELGGKNILFNLGFIAAQYLILTLYFSARRNKLILITREYIGWGDILFLFSISPLFSFPGFVFYLVSSLIFTLVVFGIAKILISGFERNNPIPLAGSLAIPLILLVILQVFIPGFSHLVSTHLSYVFGNTISPFLLMLLK